MSRIVTGAVATLGLMAFSIPSHAAITIDGVTYDGLTVSGTYQPGEDISGYGNWGDVPHLNEVIPITHGRYRFDLKTSTPVNLLDGTIYNLYWIDYTCIPEDLGYEVYCG